MAVCRSTFILWLGIAGAALIIQGCCGKRQSASGHSGFSPDEIHFAQESSAKTRPPRPYGKIKVPAELFVDLIQPKGTADTIGIIVSASSTVVASSGSLTLRIPDISGEPGRTENLWTGAPSDFIAEVREYTLPSLPVGRYHFVAIVEFIPDHPNAKQLVLSESLYVDARADRILSSNVSFRQIERLELYAELEKRALTGPHTKLAGKRLTVPYRISTEAANSALVENEMARLRATDPDIARQIMALSSQRAESKVDTEPTIRSRTIPLSSERAVPVPKEFRQ